MPDTASTLAPSLARDLLALTARACERAEEDPFGNPILSIALAITRRLDRGALAEADLLALIRYLRDTAFADRARRLAAYVGGAQPAADDLALAQLAQRLARPDPADSPVPFAAFRAALERTRFSAVFTAHPTFALAPDVLASLAASASGHSAAGNFPSHRPGPVTLEQEFAQATSAIANARDAIDRFNAALLSAAREVWPDRWSELIPRPLTVASWVGYDTDGRTDINWWDTLCLRLRMKRLQLRRLHAQLAQLPTAKTVAARVATAIGAVDAQLQAAPTNADPDQVAAFASALVDRRDDALITPGPLLEMLARVIPAADERTRLALCVARAGLVSHGLSLAGTHVRLNSAQLHNAARQRLGLSAPPADPSRRRVLLAAANAALDAAEPVAVDFGSILAEQASATRLMMTIAQLVKHIDGFSPIRFLIAETESGYTLLAALWLARLFGVERHVEICPLFETADALEHGARAIEEALRSPHFRVYLRAMGRMAVQFGYSDSGRFVGQIAASYQIERLRLKIGDALARHGLSGIELVLFDTHGESIGRGAHPGSLRQRLDYLSPPESRRAIARADMALCEESAFQGGEGYLLFGTPELALASVLRIAEHAFAKLPDATDPVYAEADFAADFFGHIRFAMQELVADPGYASLLGAFGPALLDPTGSRPVARQVDGMGGPAIIRHPREIRAIPNNAILQQLGWCANTLQGLGAAASRHPELFADLLARSSRFRQALDLSRHALAHSDIDVLRAVIALLDPGSWLDRAAHAKRPGRREALIAVARALERLGLWAPALALFRRLQTDHLALRAVWSDAPRMTTREVLLHALRIALIQRLWLLGAEIPDFSPRHGVTRQGLEDRLLRLDVPAVLDLLAEIFPVAPDPASGRAYAEPLAPRAVASYAREHAEIFEPMHRIFAMVREIGTAIAHEVGAFG